MAACAGTESHFLAGASNMRGLYSNQINPAYWALVAYLFWGQAGAIATATRESAQP